MQVPPPGPPCGHCGKLGHDRSTCYTKYCWHCGTFKTQTGPFQGPETAFKCKNKQCQKQPSPLMPEVFKFTTMIQEWLENCRSRGLQPTLDPPTFFFLSLSVKKYPKTQQTWTQEDLKFFHYDFRDIVSYIMATKMHRKKFLGLNALPTDFIVFDFCLGCSAKHPMLISARPTPELAFCFKDYDSPVQEVQIHRLLRDAKGVITSDESIGFGRGDKPDAINKVWDHVFAKYQLFALIDYLRMNTTFPTGDGVLTEKHLDKILDSMKHKESAKTVWLAYSLVFSLFDIRKFETSDYVFYVPRCRATKGIMFPYFLTKKFMKKKRIPKIPKEWWRAESLLSYSGKPHVTFAPGFTPPNLTFGDQIAFPCYQDWIRQKNQRRWLKMPGFLKERGLTYLNPLHVPPLLEELLIDRRPAVPGELIPAKRIEFVFASPELPPVQEVSAALGNLFAPLGGILFSNNPPLWTFDFPCALVSQLLGLPEVQLGEQYFSLNVKKVEVSWILQPIINDPVGGKPKSKKGQKKNKKKR